MCSNLSAVTENLTENDHTVQNNAGILLITVLYGSSPQRAIPGLCLVVTQIGLHQECKDWCLCVCVSGRLGWYDHLVHTLVLHQGAL